MSVGSVSVWNRNCHFDCYLAKCHCFYTTVLYWGLLNIEITSHNSKKININDIYLLSIPKLDSPLDNAVVVAHVNQPIKSKGTTVTKSHSTLHYTKVQTREHQKSCWFLGTTIGTVTDVKNRAGTRIKPVENTGPIWKKKPKWRINKKFAGDRKRSRVFVCTGVIALTTKWMARDWSGQVRLPLS